MLKLKLINLSVEQESAPHFPLVSEYMLHDKKLDRNYIDNFKIYEINITEMAKLCYDGEKEMYLLGMLDMSQKELESIKDDKYMDRLKVEVVEINNDEEMIKLLSEEDEERLYINTMKEIGKEEDIDFISRVSGLSKEKIEEIAKEK